MTFPAFDEASRDPSLRGTPWAVYRHLVDELDTREFTDSKRLAMCSALGIGKTAALRALDLLVARGYLELDGVTHTAPGQARRYRLNFRRRQHPHDAVDSRHPQDPAA
jgi:predicted ArsR family transcriptional regulator